MTNICYFCGGKLKKEKVDIARYWGKDLLALRDVPALVCQQCGERYFEAKVSDKIDQKIHQALNAKPDNTIDVPVVQF
ncbi:type II toxin-antitoxin system MqsA family antitoxin [Candidatus Microgenomates bacterium]|nr:type II toxin-antitoxin system MqsA family antitoxin [Candidatus Microgenomates bacterium]